METNISHDKAAEPPKKRFSYTIVEAEGDPPRILYRQSEIAAMTTLSERKIYDLREAGEIPCVRVGSRILYDPEEVKDALKKRCK